MNATNEVVLQQSERRRRRQASPRPIRAGDEDDFAAAVVAGPLPPAAHAEDVGRDGEVWRDGLRGRRQRPACVFFIACLFEGETRVELLLLLDDLLYGLIA